MRAVLDKLIDRELVLAEVELDDPDETPSLPDWLEPFVERDVTEDDEFSNEALAK